MFEVRRTAYFTAWLDDLRDHRARARIVTRLERAEGGNFGDTKLIADGVSEMRIDYGPGYRLYFVRRGTTVIVLLCGGDKTTQSADIAKARQLSREV
jgi:putative addiction module killer protein